MLEKTYQPAAVEPRITKNWDDAGAFRAGAGAEPGAQPFCIVIPPPNVTGSLHMGHAFNNTIQDILCRFQRMRGLDVLWQPGMDHAGIATQMVVERQLMERGLPGRREMGREAFIQRVWEWKNESGGAIQRQLKRLGASCDWSRERFTMDEGLSAAVRKVFVTLHRQGLIYRDKRLVNWDPKFQTAISDLEVVPVETKGNLWHFRYPVEGEDGVFITVATTRPETMLGDTAVAVHPDDERYKALIGRNVVLPLVGRRIPIVADAYADPETGSGAVKITPAHDFNDFDVGRRHDLPLVNVLDAEARLLLKENADFLAGAASGADLDAVLALDGADRFAARKQIVAMMEERGLVEKIEPHAHTVPHGDRSNVVIEPWLTDQWYVDAAKLAVPAAEAVRKGDTRFVPESWSKTFFNWMDNIQPWCVSRQLWWGHQIPAWYGPDGQAFVEETEEEALAAAARHYGHRVNLVQDEDVLDTWFSSALWPFSTLGWPEQTPELARYYPTTVLVTGFDIIFFWVARMMMSGLHFMKETPFKDVYIHALVRDEKGAKMSKSKGNVIDPLELMDQFGADAMRFTLAAFAAQGRDVKLSVGRVEGYRNFANKLWNAARFAEMNGCEPVKDFDIRSAKLPVNRWIAGEAERTAVAVEQAVETYRFNDAASAVYRFVWNVFCDWHLELIKPILSGPDGAEKEETRATCAWALGVILKLLHPFMPFITEELWTRFGDGERLLVVSRWPKLSGLQDETAEAEIGWLVELISGVRSLRAEMNVPVTATIPLVLLGATEDLKARAARFDEPLRRMARLSSVEFAEAAPKGSVQVLTRDGAAALPLAGVIDLAAEATRLRKELERLDGEIKRIDAKLSNASFVARAPEEVVEGEREKRAGYEERKAKVAEASAQLESAEKD